MLDSVILDSADEALIRAVVNTPVRPPPAAIVPGQIVVGTYEIVRRVGAGGMGVVYLARDLELRRDVAIKLHASPVNAERLRREAATIAQLNHPNVVTVYGVGTHLDRPFVAMEYVPGGTARSWCAAASRTWQEVVALYRGAGLGLAAAHAAGLVHRDFKPDNVLVGSDGRIRVADFGLALSVDSNESHEPAGTPAYMAPEQHATGEVGPAADQFAFCVAFWEALNGERPGTGRHALRAGRGPRWLRRILARGADPDPARRWPSMMALLDAIDAARVRRRRAGAALLGLCAAAAIALAAGWQARGEEPHACAEGTEVSALR
jgi:serine/threonine protein kinase